MPQPTVTIIRSHSDSVLVGTELVLTADISFSDQSRVNVDKSLDILWRRGNDVIVNDTRTTVSAVSGSGDSYTASLTYSPITISDSGQITAIVAVRPMTVNGYLRTVKATALESLNITGIHILYVKSIVIREIYISHSVHLTPSITLSPDSDSLYAGTRLNLSCNYTLPSVLVEAAVQPVVTWTVNSSAVNTTLDWISTEGDTITFSALALSDTGRYTCELTATKDLTYYSIEAHGQSKEIYVAILSKSYIEIFCSSLHMYVYSLTVPVPDVVTTPSRTTPLYAGTSVTLTCTMTIHPNVDSGESVMMRWTVPSTLSRNQYSDTGLHTSGKIYTRNITISPLLIKHSG